jgi:tight adherence protein B
MRFGVLAAVLVMLLATRATRWLQPKARAVAMKPTKHRRRRSVTFDYAAMLDSVARQVRSGSSLTSAVIEGIDRDSPLGPAIESVEAGAPLHDALAAVPAGDPDLALTTQALSATARLGGPVAATLDDSAAVLRERAATRDERRSQSSQARLSARVLTIVPLGFAIWSALASQRTRDVYMTTVAGALCLASGLVLNVAGWQWMKRIVRQ